MSYDYILKPDKEPNLTSDLSCVDGTRTGRSSVQGVLQFRHYRVEPSARVLLRNGHPVELGSRAFDLLLTLLESRGELVSKEDIIRRVWPDTIVDESNLRFQMTSLRNALGEDRDVIKTIPGRGYLLADESEEGAVLPQTYARIVSPLPEDSLKQRLNLRGTTTQLDSACNKPTVAVIDDDSGSREALHDLLESVGLRVESFESTQAFLRRAASFFPECIVLDVFLPGQNGLDFQSELAHSGVRVPIIFISGFADVHMSVQAMKAGAVEFLTKPIRYQELLNAVRHAVSLQLGSDHSRQHA